MEEKARLRDLIEAVADGQPIGIADAPDWPEERIAMIAIESALIFGDAGRISRAIDFATRVLGE